MVDILTLVAVALGRIFGFFSKGDLRVEVDRTLGSVRFGGFFSPFCSVRRRFGSAFFFAVRFGKKFGSACFCKCSVRLFTEQKPNKIDLLQPSPTRPKSSNPHRYAKKWRFRFFGPKVFFRFFFCKSGGRRVMVALLLGRSRKADE